MLPESESIVTSEDVFAPVLSVSDHAELQAWLDANDAMRGAYAVEADLDRMWCEEMARRDAERASQTDAA